MESLNAIFTWINANPAWGGVGVFLIAFCESLAMVGLILPGAAMMFGIGALVGTDILPLGPTLVWAAIGAIAGDGVSFWLGRHYHMQLKTLWPLRNHPELIANATQFFYRHGGKSILFGRFIGPIRPVIPAVAGMLEMPTRRFLQFNVISGILWAPVYVLPGMIFTTSLGLAAEVASRLAVTVGSMLAVSVLVLWLSRLGFNWLHRHTYPLIQRILWWARLHPVAGRIPASLLDPQQPEARGLTQSALLLVAATVLFGIVMNTLGRGDGLLVGLNHTLQHTLHHLRTPAVDQLMLLFSLLGDATLLFSLAALVLLWLLRSGLYRAAWHWLAAIAFAALLALALYLLGLQLQLDALSQQASANGLLLGAIACFGFLGVLLARELPQQHRWLVYALSWLLILALALAHLYLGMQSLDILLGVLTLGLAWVALLGIGYRHHPAQRVPARQLTLLSLLVIALTMGWQDPLQLEHAAPFPGDADAPITLSRQQWLQGAPQLPPFRADLRGRHTHPLNLQFAGSSEELTTLKQTLLDAGWREPPAVDTTSWLVWLNPATPPAQLPVLPQVHDGRYHQLLLTREVDGVMLALRLWHSQYRLSDTQQVVWLGNISELKAETRGGLTVPRTQLNFAQAMERFRRQLNELPSLQIVSSLPGTGSDSEPLRLGLREGSVSQ